MRKMKSQNGTILKVSEHIILKNMWEYYVLENDYNSDDIKNCLVMGFETEVGDCSMSEIKPYIISKTKNLNDVMPPTNFTWID